MMMRMLHVAGIEPYCDPDCFGNSYETSDALRLPGDSAWLAQCEGRAVKILDPLVFTPPTGHDYRFIFMRRDPFEQAKSQLKLLAVVGDIPRSMVSGRTIMRLRESIVRDTEVSIALIARLGEWLLVDFEQAIKGQHATAVAVSAFVHSGDPAQMAETVHRRGSAALPHLAEIEMLRGEGAK